MDKKLIAYPISGRNAQIIEEQTMEPVVGGTELKMQLSGIIGNKTVHLIERYDAENFLKQKLSFLWQTFKQAGLPVAPTLRKTSRNTLLFTDLTADGSTFYGKTLANILSFSKKPQQDLIGTMRSHMLFLELMECGGYQSIAQKATELAQRASDHFLQLPDDDPFDLLIHPDGSWDLMFLDLRWGIKHDSNLATEALIKKIHSNNEKSVQLLLKNIKEIRSILTLWEKVAGIEISANYGYWYSM